MFAANHAYCNSAAFFYAVKAIFVAAWRAPTYSGNYCQALALPKRADLAIFRYAFHLTPAFHVCIGRKVGSEQE